MTVRTDSDDVYLGALAAKQDALGRALAGRDGTAAGLRRGLQGLTTEKLAAELAAREHMAREAPV